MINTKSKICIILAPKSEKLVNEIITWIKRLKVSFFRITDLDEIKIINVDILKFKIVYRNSSIKNDNILSFWNRKGELNTINFNDNKNIKILSHCERESLTVFSYLVQQLEEKKNLGNYFLQIPNKLNHLYLAQKSGLEIPKTTITNNKEAIKSLNKDSPNIINKSLSDSFTGTFNQTYYYNHTERISKEIIEDLEESFFPSLFQEELEKAYELRIVFVQEKLWSMAIFSQNDKKTEVDCRNYNYEKPNRKMPFKLPIEVSENVRKFIRISGLNTGAIDMVVTKDKKYVFLECNPNGQISMVSEHCNYYIEKYIAEYLSTP